MRFIVSLFFLVVLAVAKTETVLLYNGKTLAAQSVSLIPKVSFGLMVKATSSRKLLNG